MHMPFESTKTQTLEAERGSPGVRNIGATRHRGCGVGTYEEAYQLGQWQQPTPMMDGRLMRLRRHRPKPRACGAWTAGAAWPCLQPGRGGTSCPCSPRPPKSSAASTLTTRVDGKGRRFSSRGRPGIRRKSRGSCGIHPRPGLRVLTSTIRELTATAPLARCQSRGQWEPMLR